MNYCSLRVSHAASVDAVKAAENALLCRFHDTGPWAAACKAIWESASKAAESSEDFCLTVCAPAPRCCTLAAVSGLCVCRVEV